MTASSLKQILFFSMLLVFVFSLFTSPVSTGLDYYDFYRKYIVNSYPARIIEKNIEITGSNESGITFVVHSGIVDVGGNYSHLEWKGLVYYTDTVPIISFGFRILKEHLVPRQGFPYAAYSYSILSMTHWRDINNALLLIVRVDPESDPTHKERIDIVWLYARFDPENGFEFRSDTDAGTTIVLDGGTLYSHDVHLTIIPVMYSWNSTDGVRLLFGFYTIVDIVGKTRTDFQVAWREVFFDKYNITEFYRYVQSFYRWYICLGTGSFLYRSDVNEVVYDIVSSPSVDASQSYIELVYKRVYVANAELDINRYFNDWLRGLLPEYEPRSIIDLTSRVAGLDPSMFLFLVVSVVSSTVPAYIGYRFGGSVKLSFILAVIGLTIGLTFYKPQFGLYIVSGLVLLLPFMGVVRGES